MDFFAIFATIECTKLSGACHITFCIFDKIV